MFVVVVKWAWVWLFIEFVVIFVGVCGLGKVGECWWWGNMVALVRVR